MTLRQALDMALAQNPDVVMARLERRSAAANTLAKRDPFNMKAGVGSGLAYTYGFPATINGQSPSIFQARGEMALYDRALKYRVDQARENERGAALQSDISEEQVAYQVYSAFLDAELAARSTSAGEDQIRNLERVMQLVQVRVDESSALPIESRRAAVNLERARKTVEDFRAAQTNLEIALAEMLGLPAGDQVRPAQEERPPLMLNETEEEAVRRAIAESKEIRQLESNIIAKQLEVKSYDAEHLPKINLFLQYSLLARYNNFDVFFPRFQRNNAQLGASFEIPLFLGTAVKAGKAAAETEIDKLRVQVDRTRSRIAADVQRSYAELERAETERDLRREERDLARDELDLVLTQYDEGTALMAQVEAARATEQQMWLQFYDAERGVAVARLNILRDSGALLAALK